MYDPKKLYILIIEKLQPANVANIKQLSCICLFVLMCVLYCSWLSILSEK